MATFETRRSNVTQEKMYVVTITLNPSFYPKTIKAFSHKEDAYAFVEDSFKKRFRKSIKEYKETTWNKGYRDDCERITKDCIILLSPRTYIDRYGYEESKYICYKITEVKAT